MRSESDDPLAQMHFEFAVERVCTARKVAPPGQADEWTIRNIRDALLYANHSTAGPLHDRVAQLLLKWAREQVLLDQLLEAPVPAKQLGEMLGDDHPHVRELGMILASKIAPG